MNESEVSFVRLQKIRTIIMITVVILLIIWTILFFYMTNKEKNKVLVDNNYDKNQKLMQQVARKYFTDDVLDNNITIISLKSMYEKELIDKLETSYKKECVDLASYAKVSKLDDKYKLDIVLVCGDNNETLTSYYDLECGLNCDI